MTIENGQRTLNVVAGSMVTAIDAAAGPACMDPDVSELKINVEAGAQLHLISMRGCAAGYRRDARIKVTVGQDATFRLTELRLGGGRTSSEVDVELWGVGAAADVRSALFCADDDRLASHVSVRHFASRGTSRIITRAVLAGHSRAGCRGLISIGRGLEDCRGEQRADALLLSADARADFAPNLQIGTDDVSCRHGVGISGLDEGRLFYLMSRGLTRREATDAAVRGFLAPIWRELDESLVVRVEDAIAARMVCALKCVK